MNETSATTTESAAPASDRYVIDGRVKSTDWCKLSLRLDFCRLWATIRRSPFATSAASLSSTPRNALEAGSLWIAIKSSSLSVQDDISPKDIREMERIMNQDVLETGKFPGIQV